ncbi:MAG TPA: hypothetical protein VJ932_00970, partial [Alkalispirochaeta sp.]|nr:hypothetical protein [Alkalispirochaeta sp.]
LEIPVLDSWTVSIWGRQFLSFLTYYIAQNTTTAADVQRFIPGVGGRWYRGRNGSAAESAAALRGWYVGALFELLLWGDLSFMLPEEEVVDPRNPPVKTDGWIVMPQIEGGYRFGLWRSAFIDVGVQVGYATGTGLYGEDLQIEPDGSSSVEQEGEFNNSAWGSLVLSFGTALY